MPKTKKVLKKIAKSAKKKSASIKKVKLKNQKSKKLRLSIKKAAKNKTKFAKKILEKSKIPAKIKGPANLLITYDPSHAGASKREVLNLLKQTGQEGAFVKESEGTFQIKVKDSRGLVKSLQQVCRIDSALFANTFHWVPIDKWCKADIKTMKKEIGKLEKQIGETERWKMQLNKRSYKMGFNELIVQLTSPIDRRFVDLKAPEKIVQVEILGKLAGISLLKNDECLDVPKLKAPKL